MNDRAELWRQVIATGGAGEVCDRIIRARPVPAALLRAIAQMPPDHRERYSLPAHERLRLQRMTR